LFIPKRKKEKKKKEKRHFSMVCECWWAPDGIGLPWFVKGKKVGRSAKLYKRAQKYQSLSKTCFIFVWKIVRTPLPVIDKNNHLSRPNFLSICFTKEKL
jgi:hypothetical protein